MQYSIVAGRHPFSVPAGAGPVEVPAPLSIMQKRLALSSVAAAVVSSVAAAVSSVAAAVVSSAGAAVVSSYLVANAPNINSDIKKTLESFFILFKKYLVYLCF